MKFSRRSILRAGVGIAALLAASASDALLLGKTLATLPTTTVSNVAIKGSANAYVDLGLVGLPAGDWFIAVTAAPGSVYQTDYFLFNLGALNDNNLTNNSSLTIGWPGVTNDARTSYGWAAVGKDDAGVGLSPVQRYFFAASQQFGVTGPQQVVSSVLDTVARTIVVQKKAGVISIWVIDPACRAIQYCQQVTSFGAIAPVLARLGCLGTAAPSGFTSITYQLFMKGAGSLTPYQMEAVAGGVDPRAVINFSGEAGDLLFAFDSAASDGKTYRDLIQGQIATAHGTFATATALLPTSVDQNQIRADVQRYEVLQNNVGGTTADFVMPFNVYGADGDIQVKLVNASNSTVQVPYTTVGTSRNGTCTGFAAGMIPNRVADYRLIARKMVNGVQVGNEYFVTQNIFAVGPVVQWLGQSIAEQMTTNGSYNNNSGTLAFNGRYQSSLYDIATSDHMPAGCSKQISAGYGEGRLTQVVGNGLGNQQFMQVQNAVSGTTKLNWINDQRINTNSPYGIMTSANRDAQRFRPFARVWLQGEQDAGQSYADAYSQMDQVFNLLMAGWSCEFWLVPVDNNFDGSFNKDVQFQNQRSAQIDWARDKIAAGDTRVRICCTFNDVLRADTDSGGIHKTTTAGGYGMLAERVAQTILYRYGVVANSGLGPQITSIQRISNTVKRFIVTQNGGTGLQTLNGGAPTGFFITLSNAMFTSGPTFTSPLAVSSVAISGANSIDVTHASDGGNPCYGWYQPGLPGLGITDAAEYLTNVLNDNRVPAINQQRGYPLMPLSAAMLAA